MGKRDWTMPVLAGLLLLVGVYCIVLPHIREAEQKTQARSAVEAFFQAHPQAAPSPSEETLTELPKAHDLPASTETEPELPYAALLQAMRDYNEELYANGQAGLTDPWAYTAEAFDLSESGLDNEIVAVLTVPKLELQEPVYLGATKAHLDNGIAQFTISSMPIGGVNTNCVLAGHRGWHGAAFFRYIERLETGDEVTLTNLWETLTYRVCEIKIIQPWQAEKILIQPGRDLLTLITCHPYGSGGKFRYVVYCERVP